MATIMGFTTSNPLLRGTEAIDTIYGNSLGPIDFVAGSDTIRGFGGDDTIAGDGSTVAANGKGGNDRIEGGTGDDRLFGDATGSVWGIAGNDVIYGDEPTTQPGPHNGRDWLIGDSGDTLFGVGGNDTLYASSEGSLSVGDAWLIAAGCRGGDDRIFGGGEISGDSMRAMVDAVGGDDLIDASAATRGSRLYGEVAYGTTLGGMTGSSFGGADTIIGSAFEDQIYGEATAIFGQTRAGNDQLAGGGGRDFIVGDASLITDAARGGNDVLQGGAGDDELFGDGTKLASTARGGDDVLVGGEGNDLLNGDGRLVQGAVGGKDQFVFEGDFGHDRVLDFRPEEGDQILFKGIDQKHVQIVLDGADPALTLDTGQSVTLVGFFGNLTVGTDILFA